MLEHNKGKIFTSYEITSRVISTIILCERHLQTAASSETLTSDKDNKILDSLIPESHTEEEEEGHRHHPPEGAAPNPPYGRGDYS